VNQWHENTQKKTGKTTILLAHKSNQGTST
jgi:hypothetical protein